jgi:hypothetical protein
MLHFKLSHTLIHVQSLFWILLWNSADERQIKGDINAHQCSCRRTVHQQKSGRGSADRQEFNFMSPKAFYNECY